MDLQHYLKVAEHTARKAGAALRSSHAVWSSTSEVTRRDVKLDADRNSESLILSALRTETDVPILSEEAGSRGGDPYEGLRWVVDPLDGTVNYARSIPLAAVSIALLRDGVPLLGVIHDFNHDETFTGSAGGGAFLNGMPITVSSVAAPEQAALATGLPARRDYSQSAMGEFARNLARWHKVRMFGTAATSLAYVAAGRIDAYQESSIMLWDVAAGWALVEAAGGKIRATLLSSPAVLSFAAANFHLLEAFVDM